MKKILMMFAVMFSCTAIVSAQKTTAKPATPPASKSVAATPAKPAATSAKPAPATVKTAKPAAAPTKADGTPDMRYKENQKNAKPAAAGPKKADGTPDMRYKANQKPKAKS